MAAEVLVTEEAKYQQNLSITMVMTMMPLEISMPQFTGNSTVCLAAYSGQQIRKHQSSLLAFHEENPQWLVVSPHKGPAM